MAREGMDICLRVLKESNKSRFDSYNVRNSILIISHITFRDCRGHIFFDNLSRNSCIYRRYGNKRWCNLYSENNEASTEFKPMFSANNDA